MEYGGGAWGVAPEEWAERLELWKFFHQSRHSLAMRFVHSISIY